MAEDVQTWYELSKPYQLKIFDMRIRHAILFSEVEAACRMMAVGPKELAPVRQHCNEQSWSRSRA